MGTLAIALGAMVLYIIAYHTYGKWLAKKIFKLDPNSVAPSVEIDDGEDFVPTKKSIIFGHHFTSIAGTGPIVGPALAVIWGWVPALLWVLFGSIFIGAVHDFGALVVSLRNKGQTVGDIAGKVVSPQVRVLFLIILFLALTIVLAIFGLVIAAVFRLYPQSIFPCLIQIPIAILIGLMLHKKGVNLILPSLIALALMYASVWFGDVGFLKEFNSYLQSWSIFTWVVLLLLYSYIASVLPVWTLLQPRDFINSLQLISILVLLVGGMVVTAFLGGEIENGVGVEKIPLQIVADPIRLAPEGAPMMFPFLFITIACGAISGFHCLVSSGTSSKQIRCETDAKFVGFGSMLTEGFLAVLVILACVAGIGLGIKGEGETMLFGKEAYEARYASWNQVSGLGAKVGAFVEGAANFLKGIGIPANFAVALMGVFVASFAATTLDTACRLQRYVTQELASTLKITFLTKKHTATLFAIVIAGIVASLPLPGKNWSLVEAGKGGLILWPLFGATNQLLAGLAFIVVIFWMKRKGLPTWFVILPAILMLVLPFSAMTINLLGENGWVHNDQWHLVVFGIIILLLQIWIIVEAVKIWPKIKK